MAGDDTKLTFDYQKVQTFDYFLMSQITNDCDEKAVILIQFKFY